MGTTSKVSKKSFAPKVIQLLGGFPFEMPVIVLTILEATLKANGLFLFPSGVGCKDVVHMDGKDHQ